MNKKTRDELYSFHFDIKELNKQYAEIMLHLNELIEREQESVDKLMDYPQFENKADDKQLEVEELEEIYQSMDEALGMNMDIMDHLRTMSGLTEKITPLDFNRYKIKENNT